MKKVNYLLMIVVVLITLVSFTNVQATTNTTNENQLASLSTQLNSIKLIIDNLKNSVSNLFSSNTQQQLALVTPVAGGETVTRVREDCSAYTLGSDCFTSLSAWEAAYGGIDFGVCTAGDLTCVNTTAVAQIEGAWTLPDTTAVRIEGWTTSATNYIKIYTTTDARHNGTAGSGYRLDVNGGGSAIFVAEIYTIIDGLEITRWGLSSGSRSGITTNANAIDYVTISNNLIHDPIDLGATLGGIDLANGSDGWKIYNNIIYNIDKVGGGATFGIEVSRTNYVYNNTVYNAGIGFLDIDSQTTLYLKNNIAVNNVDGNYSGTFDSTSDYNISSDATSPASGANDKTNQTVSFVSTTLGSEDFHLSSSDTSAKDAGTNLSADANLSFTTDIDGITRSGTWDIGADEYTATEFVSSIQESGGDYSSLFDWEAAVQTDIASASSTTRVFSGSVTGTLTGNNVVELFRGGTYQNITGSLVATTSTQILIDGLSSTSLRVNSADEWRVASSTANMFTVSGTGAQLGDSAIAVAKIEGAWTTADTTAVVIDGWTTSAANYIKIYTTASARHGGVWDTSKYRLEDIGYVLKVLVNNVKIYGLQIGLTGTGGYDYGVYSTNSNIEIAESIIREMGGTGTNRSGISLASGDNNYVWNNIVYGFNTDSTSNCIYLSSSISPGVWAYNNTVSNCYFGIKTGYLDTVAKNNIAQNSTDGYYTTNNFDASSDYNISDIASDAPGANSKNSTTVSFVSTTLGSEDFHLSSSDTSAKDAGTNLSADANLSFTTDIDGDIRCGDWDIGADKYNLSPCPTSGNSTPKTIIKGGVNLKGGVNFK